MIRRVASHPVALAQCRRFFAERPQVEAVTAYDTAGAVQDLMKGGLATQGAIASRLAAELYGGVGPARRHRGRPRELHALPAARRATPARSSRRARPRSCSCSTTAPARSTTRSASSPPKNVDLCKLESRPLRGHPWEYSFYLDVLGDPNGTAGEAIEELGRACRELRILGSYPEGLSRNGA